MDYESIAKIMKTIAHPDRIRIAQLLKGKEMNVSDIHKKLDLKQAVTSQHLTRMKDNGLLSSRRSGNTVFYSLTAPEVMRVIGCIEDCGKNR